MEMTTIPNYVLPIGTLLAGKYEITGLLGSGGFGITYKGLDMDLQCPVAIKEYYPHGYANRYSSASLDVTLTESENKEYYSAWKEKFLAEARVLAKFENVGGIVNVKTYFEQNNTAYMVMNFLEGVTLKEYIKNNGKMPPEEICQKIIPILYALSQVHSKGVIHRDISPSNIMLRNDGTLTLFDFGAAREYDNGGHSLSIVLKHGYAPWEQYMRNGKQGPFTDVYAMCATLYYCITGVTPVEAGERLNEDNVDTMEPVSKYADVPSYIETTIMKGMSIKSKDRFQSMDELAEALLNSEMVKIQVYHQSNEITGKENTTPEMVAPESSNSEQSIPKTNTSDETVYINKDSHKNFDSSTYDSGFITGSGTCISQVSDKNDEISDVKESKNKENTFADSISSASGSSISDSLQGEETVYIKKEAVNQGVSIEDEDSDKTMLIPKNSKLDTDSASHNNIEGQTKDQSSPADAFVIESKEKKNRNFVPVIGVLVGVLLIAGLITIASLHNNNIEMSSNEPVLAETSEISSTVTEQVTSAGSDIVDAVWKASNEDFTDNYGNSGKYWGDMKGSQPDGKGVFQYKGKPFGDECDVSYSGYWSVGTRNGQGTENGKYSDGTKYKWEGTYYRDRWTDGTLTWYSTNGVKEEFKGTWHSDGSLSGNDVSHTAYYSSVSELISSSKTGEYDNGYFNGKIIQTDTYTDNTVRIYEGNCINGQWDGNSTLTWTYSDGGKLIISGSASNNRMVSGDVVYFDPDGKLSYTGRLEKTVNRILWNDNKNVDLIYNLSGRGLTNGYFSDYMEVGFSEYINDSIVNDVIFSNIYNGTLKEQWEKYLFKINCSDNCILVINIEADVPDWNLDVYDAEGLIIEASSFSLSAGEGQFDEYGNLDLKWDSIQEKSIISATYNLKKGVYYIQTTNMGETPHEGDYVFSAETK